MRAARLHAKHDLRIENVERPHPGLGEVLIRVERVGICGSDVHFFLEGHVGSMNLLKPHVPGHEFCGIVAEVGPGVSDLDIGDRVAGNPVISCGSCELCQEGMPNLCLNPKYVGTPPWPGAMQEYFAHPAEFCLRLPEDLSSTSGALLEPLAVAIHSVDAAEIHPAYSVAVIGCGPIGLFLLQMSRLSGAVDVYASELMEARLAAARGFGVTEVFDASKVDIVKEILTATNGRGVDVTFEAAGFAGSLAQSVRVTRRGGKVIVLGTPNHSVSADPTELRHREMKLEWTRRFLQRDYSRALKLVSRGIVDVEDLVSHHFSLESAPQAFETLVNGKESIKVVIDI